MKYHHSRVKYHLSLTTNYKKSQSYPLLQRYAIQCCHINRIQPKIEAVLRSNQNSFSKNTFLTIRRITEVRAKDLEAVILFVDFSKAFDSVNQGKMIEIKKSYGILEETITATMMLYKNTKSMARSPAGDTDFFEVLSGLLRGYTLTPFFFVLLIDYVLQTSVDRLNEISFTLKKARRYLAKTITKN